MDESRNAFEQYAAGRLGLPLEMISDARNGDRYMHAFDSMSVMQPINGWWTLWQASRAAIEIELPRRKAAYASGYGDGYLVDSLMGDALEYDETVEAIRAIGIKVKE